MLLSLSLRNFKKHESLEIDFTEGLNGIFGPNYSGKTTVLYGILFALGGTSAVPGTRIATRGSSSSMKVELEFEISGKKYRVTRTKTTANLETCEGELLASGTTGVNEKIEELLGASFKRFCQLRYAEQKDAQALLTLGASELHKLLEDLTGITVISNAIEALKNKGVVVNAQLEALPEVDSMDSIWANIQEAEEALKDSSQELGTLESRKAELESQSADAARKVAKQWEAKRKQDEAKEALRKWQVDYDAASSKLELLREQLENLDPVGLKKEFDYTSKQYIELKSTIAKITEWNEEYVNASKRAVELDIERHKLSVELAAKESESPPAVDEKELEFLTAEVDRVKDLKSRVLADFKSLTEARHNAVCPTCNRAYETADIASLDEKIALAEGQASHVTERLKTETRKLEILKAQKKDYTDFLGQKLILESLLHAKTQEAKEAEKRLNSVESRHKEFGLTTPKLPADFEEAKEEVNRLRKLTSSLQHKMEQVDEYEVSLDQLTRKQEALKASAPASPSKQDESHLLEEANKELLEIRERIQIVTENIIPVSQHVGTLKRDLDGYKAELEHAEKCAARYKELTTEKGKVHSLTQFLRKNRDRYANETWDFFMASASQFVSNCTNGAISEIRRTEDGKFLFIEDGHVMTIKEASGAQSSIMGLAIQAALSQAAQFPLDILMVDEPTADMDGEHSMATMALLASESAQVISVSHQDMDRSICNNTISL